MDGGRETLDEYVAGTWAKAHAVHLAPRTQELYSSLFDSHISPTLGAMPLREFTPDLIGRWQAALVEDDVPKPSVKKAMTLLGNLLQRAAESGRIASNPQRVVRRLRLTRPQEVRPLPPSAIERMRAASEPRDATLISVLAYAGLRPGEALLLRWAHLGEKTIVVFAPKTGARRTVRLLDPLADDLGEWRRCSERTSDDDLIFPGVAGEPWSTEAYKSWRRRAFRDAARAAGVSKATPYALRHSFCSLLLAEGRSVIDVARQLGHGAGLTLSTYGHVIDEFAELDRVDAEEAIRAARAEITVTER